MKKRLFFLPLLMLFMGFWQDGYSSHIMGADLTYECINACTIRVHFRGYRDCTGVAGMSNNVVFTGSGAGCTSPTPVTNWSAQQTTEVTPICPGFPTRCTNGSATINGAEEYYWWRDYNICSQPGCSYTLSWTDCCRNPAIQSIPNPGGASIYIGSTTYNGSLGSCNSSPQFSTPPVPYICAGQPYTFNQGAFDPDNDSLSYAIGPCFQGAGQPLTYNGGYSGAAPLGASWNVSINSATGDITILPNPGNITVGILCVYVFEWRNGVQINTIVRDIQMTVIPCPSNTAPSIPAAGITNLQGGFSNGPMEVTVCAGSQLSFDIPITDPNAGQVQTVFWNSNLAGQGATFTLLGNPSVADTLVGNLPTGHFTWTPLAQGNYYFLVTMRDNSCPIYGQNQYTITIHVNGGLVGSTATAVPTGCVDAAFNASPGLGGTGPYTYLWSGGGNIGLNPGINTNGFNHTFPGPGSYNYTCVITDAYGCQGTVNDVIVIAAGPVADAGPDVSICSGYNVTLGATNIVGQTYNWLPATNLSSGTAADPTFSFVNPGATPQTFNYVLTATSGLCTAIDYVTVVVNPTPVASISGNLSICDGNSTTLTANGGTSFLWSTGATTQSITVSPTQTTTYTVVVDDNGCSSQPAQVTVNVSQGPTAIISGPSSVCPGSSATLTVVGGTSWLWSTGATTQSITLTNITSSQTVTVVPAVGTCLGQPVSFTVDVSPKPVADFSATTQCIGTTTSFTDLSTVANSSIVSWSWNFGDPLSGPLNFSNTQNPTHDFTIPGIYNVTLMVQSANGCRDTVIRQVTVNPLPVPNFTFSDVCEDATVTFTNTTPGNITTYLWDFGDGATASTTNTTHQYAAPGSYNVTLTVTNNNGCTNSVTRTVFVHPKADPNFTYENSCFNTITTFENLTTLTDPFGTLIGAYAWNFGDANSGASNISTDINPVHSFTAPGTYSVTLTVTTTKGCISSITLPVVIEPIAPLVAINDTICSGESATVGISAVPPGMLVEWFYTNTSTEPFQAGFDVFDFQTPPLLFGTVYWVGIMDPDDGCRSARTPVFVTVNQAPFGDITVNNQFLEIPNAVAEFDAVISPTSSPIATYSWTFGDGATGSGQSPVHQYTEEGVYDISVTITDIYGCVTTYNLNEFITVDMLVTLFVPNAFSPNEDGKNDEFYVVHRLVTDFQIDIVDRWGKLIYSTQDINFKWNGRDRADIPLAEGVYVYTINGTAYDGSKVHKTGSITLLR